MHRAASNPPNQGKKKKDGGNKNHTDKDAPISSISYIRDLRVEGTDILKWQTRRVTPDGGGLHDRRWRNGNYFRDWGKSISTHNAKWGSPEGIWNHRRPGWKHGQYPSKTNQGRVYLVTFPPQRAKQAETRHEACHEETSGSPDQEICSTTNGIKQLPSTFTGIKQRQEYGSWRTQWYPSTRLPKLAGMTSLPTGMGFRGENLQGHMRHVWTNVNRRTDLRNRRTF